MKLSTKSVAGLVVVAVTICVLAAVAFYGSYRLSSALNYIVGPAWDSADGAMETNIELQHQMGYTHSVLAGKKVDESIITESRKSANAAINRLIHAGMVSDAQTRDLKQKKEQYEQLEIQLLDAFDRFSATKNVFENTTEQLVELMEELEEFGDSAVEEIEQNPNRTISWNSGLRQKWQAADGGMETTIGLLQQLYYLERLLKGEDFNAMKANVQHSAEFMREAMQEMLATKMFNRGSQKMPGQSMEQALVSLHQEFNQLLMQVIDQYQQYHQANLAYEKHTVSLLESLVAVEELGDSKVEEQVDVAASLTTFVNTLVTIAFVIGLAIIASLIYLTRREVIKPLRAITDRLREVSRGDGDLSQRINIQRDDEIGELSMHFDEFVSKLQQLIKDVLTNNQQMTGLVSNATQSSQKIFHSAEKSSLHADEVAAASEEMSSVSSGIAENCNQASQSADKASQLASDGQQVVKQTIDSMKLITQKVEASSSSISTLKDQADKIGDMVSVIAGISEQTNLLALNAAIEAARAGEQGRGFAVVADEVRTLAQRTANSTREISDVIHRIQECTNDSFEQMKSCVQEVTDGLERSADAGNALNSIRGNMDSLADMIQQVAVATEQQSVTISEVTTKVQSIADLARSSNEDAHASLDNIEQLGNQSSRMQVALSQFKLE